MAVIYTYPKLETPDVLDLLLITDVTDSNKTKQTTVKGIGDAIDVVDSITSLEPISVSSSTGDVEISLTGINGFGRIGRMVLRNALNERDLEKAKLVLQEVLELREDAQSIVEREN